VAESLEPPFDQARIWASNTCPGWTWSGTYGRDPFLQADLPSVNFEHASSHASGGGVVLRERQQAISAGVSRATGPADSTSAVVLGSESGQREPWPEADGCFSLGDPAKVCGVCGGRIARRCDGRFQSARNRVGRPCHTGWHEEWSGRHSPSRRFVIEDVGSRRQESSGGPRSGDQWLRPIKVQADVALQVA